MSYEIICEKCNYEGSCEELPKGYNLKKCPKCGARLTFHFIYWNVPAFYLPDDKKKKGGKQMEKNILESFTSALLCAAVRKQSYEQMLELRSRKWLGKSLLHGIQSAHSSNCFFIGEILSAIKQYRAQQRK